MKTHAIHWRSSINGSNGTGTKRFEKEVAEHLATELNEGYPDIDHEAVIPVPAAAESAADEPAHVLTHSNKEISKERSEPGKGYNHEDD